MSDFLPGGPVGRRLLHQAIDDVAQHEPSKVWALLPKRNGDGFESVTYATLANAINIMAHFMTEELKKPNAPGSFPTVCYIGKPDIRYTFVEIAAAKTRYKALFSSHINSLPAHLNLLKKSECSILLSASGVAVDDILDAHPMEHHIIPELDDILAAQAVRPYLSLESFEATRRDPFLILHTSGTTGLPKPITYTHGAVAGQDSQYLSEPFTAGEVERRGWQRQRWVDVLAGKFTAPFAPFHIILSVPVMVFTVFGRSTFVFAARDSLPSTSQLMQAAEQCDTLWLTPSTLEAVASNDKWLKSLSNFKHIVYAGGALATATGKKLSTKTKIINKFGTTEIGGSLLTGVTAPEDFDTMLFDPDLNGLDWRPQGLDGDGRQLYEMVLVKKPELDGRQSLFEVDNFKEEGEHSMGDLWVKHDTKPFHWLYRGRTDDLICFASGLKFNANGVQDRLKSHPLVEEAILYGERRAQTLLLLQLNEAGLRAVDTGKEDEILASIWEGVEGINREIPSIASIARTHILLTSRDRPFLKSPKGSVRRSATLDLYMNEIEQCYEKYGDKGPEILGRVEANGNNL